MSDSGKARSPTEVLRASLDDKNSKVVLVACTLKGREEQSSWNKFRKPVLRFKLFEKTDALSCSFSEIITNAVQTVKQTAKSFRHITVVIGRLFSSRTLSGLNWYSSTAAMFVSRQSWAQWRHAIWRRCYCPIFEQGFHMVRKCFGGWNFGECSIFVLTFCWWKEKKECFSGPYQKVHKPKQNKT